MDNLRYIRETMERAGSFTAVPGWGGVAMGLTALASAFLASQQTSQRAWLQTWLVEGSLAIALGILAMWRKASAAGLPVWSAPARKFVFSFVPPLIAGGAVTIMLWQRRTDRRDPRRLADALRHRRHHRRSVFGPHRPRHGSVLPG